MNTEYYLKIKTDFQPEISSIVGYKNADFEVLKLDKGYVWNKRFFFTKQELNKEYFRTIFAGFETRGWYYSLPAYLSESLTTLGSWITLINDPKTTVVNAVGDPIEKSEMIKKFVRSDIAEKIWTPEAREKELETFQKVLKDTNYAIPDTFQELLSLFQAEEGVNKLFKHQHCPPELFVSGYPVELFYDIAPGQNAFCLSYLSQKGDETE